VQRISYIAVHLLNDVLHSAVRAAGRRLSWDRDDHWDWHRGWNGDHWNRGLNWDDDDHHWNNWHWDVAAPNKNAVQHDVGVEGLGDMAMWGSPAGADMGLWTGGGTEMGESPFLLQSVELHCLCCWFQPQRSGQSPLLVHQSLMG
jgi:hypothetical protein